MSRTTKRAAPLPGNTGNERGLTQAWVDGLKVPPGERTVRFDDPDRKGGVKGLALRASPTAKSYYFIGAVHGGGQRWVRLGNADSITLDDARNLAPRAAKKLAEGVDPNEEKRQKRSAEEEARQTKRHEVTLAGLVKAYSEAQHERGRLAPRTRDEHARTIGKDVESHPVGKKAAGAVTVENVESLLRAVNGKHQRERVLFLIRAAYRWALKRQMKNVPSDPTMPIERYTTKADRVRTSSLISKEAEKESEAWASVTLFWRGTESLGPVSRAFVRILFLALLRRGEAAALTWDSVELDGDHPVMVIPAEHRKRSRRGPAEKLRQPLSPLAVESLRELKEVTGSRERVFYALHVGGVGALLKKATGLNVKLHDLRRSGASGLERLGAPPHVISAALGHREEGTSSDAHYKMGGRVEEVRRWLGHLSDKTEALIGRGAVSKVAAFQPRG